MTNSSLTKTILASLGTGVIITTALLFPGAGLIYKEFKKEDWENKRKRGILRATIKRLAKQKLVSWKDEGEEVTLTLTQDGKNKLLAYKIDEMTLEKPEKWDGMFRIIVFDVPNDKKSARDAMRKKLKDLGFMALQESVFMTPFECRSEIDFLRHTLGIAENTRYILAKEVSDIDIKFFR